MYTSVSREFSNVPEFDFHPYVQNFIESVYFWKRVGLLDSFYKYMVGMEYTHNYIVDSRLVDESLVVFANKSRLLSADYPLVLPLNQPIRILASSSDVLHSFAIPSLGIKIDAAPGRLNQVSAIINRFGIMYGQCSEICGYNHYAMPIHIEVVDPLFGMDNDLDPYYNEAARLFFFTEKGVTDSSVHTNALDKRFAVWFHDSVLNQLHYECPDVYFGIPSDELDAVYNGILKAIAEKTVTERYFFRRFPEEEYHLWWYYPRVDL